MKAMTVSVLDLHCYNPITTRQKQNRISKGCGRRKSKSAERMLAKTRIKKAI
jgi:hypothetical protein